MLFCRGAHCVPREPSRCSTSRQCLKKAGSLTVVSIRRTRPNFSYSLSETGPIVCLIRVPSMRTLKRAQKAPGLQIRLLAENDIGGVFAWIHAPVVASGEIATDRTAQPRPLV